LDNTVYLFDFAETIATLSPNRLEQVAGFLHARDIERSLEQIAEVAWEADEIFIYSSVEIRTEAARRGFYIEYNNYLLNRLGVEGRSLPAEMYEFIKSSSRHWLLREYVLKELEVLKSNGKKVGILSNFDPVLEKILTRLGVKEYLDYVWISALVGLEKPDQRFYDMFLSHFEIEPAKCLYLGDSLVRDYYPAAQAGMHAVLLKNGFTHYPGDIRTVSNVSEFCRLRLDD